MQLKRYTTQELQELVPNIFFEYMLANGVEEVKKDYENTLNEYREAHLMYVKALSDCSLDEEAKESVKKELEYITQGLKYLKVSNRKNQKKLYEETKSTDFCRSIIKIPLNKRLNSFYDDISAEVVFYDDVCTPSGKYEEYSKIESEEDQLEFLMRNIEITNIGLVYEHNNRRVAILELFGELNYEDERVESSSIELLPKKFSDFKNLTLNDTTTIKNNDLKQWLQTKIDLDKENMKELARVFIRGDYYSIHQPENAEDLFIRYICRSTGRVYYNRLNLRNLEISEYFEKDNYVSYAKSWWNLTHLGSKIDGKPVIAC